MSNALYAPPADPTFTYALISSSQKRRNNVFHCRRDFKDGTDALSEEKCQSDCNPNSEILLVVFRGKSNVLDENGGQPKASELYYTVRDLRTYRNNKSK